MHTLTVICNDCPVQNKKVNKMVILFSSISAKRQCTACRHCQDTCIQYSLFYSGHLILTPLWYSKLNNSKASTSAKWSRMFCTATPEVVSCCVSIGIITLACSSPLNQLYSVTFAFKIRSTTWLTNKFYDFHLKTNAAPLINLISQNHVVWRVMMKPF